MKDIEREFGLDLFDRFRIAYRKNKEIYNCSRDEFAALLSSGQLNEDTLVFNNMVSLRKDLETSWEVPLKNSWHAQVFSDDLQAGRKQRESQLH